MEPHPIRLTFAEDDLRRSRATAFFRIILAIPLLIWAYLFGILAILALIASWFAAVVTGRVPRGLHNFLTLFLRFGTHMYAYVTILAAPYPGFLGEPGYPVDVEVDPPEAQGRWGVAFRAVLAIPATILSAALGYALTAIGVFNWVTGTVLGRVMPGLVGLARYLLRVQTQVNGYALLLTSRYPRFDPAG